MNCYDALLYTDKPDLGIDQVHVEYHMQRLVKRDADHVARVDYLGDDVFDEIIAKSAGKLCVLDQEAFGGDTDPYRVSKSWVSENDHKNAIGWLIDFVRRLRTRPGGSSLRLGYYGIVPWRHTWASDGNYRKSLARLKSFRGDSGRFSDTGLIDVCDVIVPTMYCHTSKWKDHVAWMGDALATWGQVFDKPLLPFVWGHLHDATDPTVPLLPDAWADSASETIKPFAEEGIVEAVVLWGGNKTQWQEQYWVRQFLAA